MSKRHQPDVLVVGGGPVGLFAALVLARRGVSVRIVDEAWRETARSYALALHPGTLALLAEHGLADDVLARSQRVDCVAFYEGQARALEVPFARLASQYPFLAVLPQHDLETLLVERLRDHAVDVEWSHRAASFVPAGDRLAVEVQRLGKVSSGYAVAHTDWVVDAVSTESPRYIIGADGHDSLVRRHLGIELDEAGQPSLYAVFEMTGAESLAGELRVVLGERTTDVLWPLPQGRFRWSFQIEDEDRLRLWRDKSRLAFSLRERNFPYVDGEAFAELVRERAPWFALQNVGDACWSVLVRFERRLAASFGRGRVWLAGDAAHVAGPLSVRSMNVGLREAADLAGRIARVLDDQAQSAQLEAYDEDRLREWRGLLDLERRAEAGTRRERVLGCLPVAGAELDALTRFAGLV